MLPIDPRAGPSPVARHPRPSSIAGGAAAAAAVEVDDDVALMAEQAAQRQAESVFSKALGLQTFINCTATYTVNGGSLQLPEVTAAMAEAMTLHLNLNDLNAAAGARIAELLQVEAAMVRPPAPLDQGR